MSKGRTAVCAYIQSLCSGRAALPENGMFENGLFSDSQQVVPLEDCRLRSVRVRHDPSQFRKVCFQSGKKLGPTYLIDHIILKYFRHFLFV